MIDEIDRPRVLESQQGEGEPIVDEEDGEEDSYRLRKRRRTALIQVQKRDMNRRRVENEEELDYNIFMYLSVAWQMGLKRERASSLYRKRWDEDYLWNLAITEGSFVEEYRMLPLTFDLLHETIKGQLEVDVTMAARAMNTCNSTPISTRSRLASALVLLGGGKPMESMRTHGLA